MSDRAPRHASSRRPAGPGSSPAVRSSKASRSIASSSPRRAIRTLAAAARSARRWRHTPANGAAAAHPEIERGEGGAGRRSGLGKVGERRIMARPTRQRDPQRE